MTPKQGFTAAWHGVWTTISLPGLIIAPDLTTRLQDAALRWRELVGTCDDVNLRAQTAEWPALELPIKM